MLLDPFDQSRNLKHVFGLHQDLFSNKSNSRRLLTAVVRNNLHYASGPFYN